jgi:hypothetical protein
MAATTVSNIATQGKEEVIDGGKFLRRADIKRDGSRIERRMVGGIGYVIEAVKPLSHSCKHAS